MQTFDRSPLPASKQSLTAQGFLICRDVPVARTGEMLYGAHEVGPQIPAAMDGTIRIARSAEEVFAPETIASFEHAPVTDAHPPEFVNAQNWKDHSVGYTQNVRRGTGDQVDKLIADLVVTHQGAIDLVRGGQREVSCGYDCDYVAVAPGCGEQKNLRGNHIALVERGRCGPVCAIGDSATAKEPLMSTSTKKRTAWDRIMTAFKAQDEEAIAEAISEAKEEAEQSDTTQKVVIEVTPSGAVSASDPTAATDAIARDKAIDERFSKIEDSLGKISQAIDALPKVAVKDEADPDDKKDPEKTKTGDAALDGSWELDWQDTVARAEIVSPGIKIPTRDSALTKQKAQDTLCALRRGALDAAFKSEKGKAVIAQFTGPTPDFKGMTCDMARVVFVGASNAMGDSNNRAHMTVLDAASVTDAGHTLFAATGAERNKKNRDFWAKH